MTTACVRDAFEALGVTCEAPSATAVEATGIVTPPPRHPRPECKVTTVRRRIGCRRSGNGPVGLRIGETAARIVFGVNREIGLAADKVRSWAFHLCCHFKFRTAKFLDLKLMSE